MFQPNRDTPERKERRDQLIEELGDDIIKLLNEKVIQPHELSSADAIYVASTVLAEAAAIIMFDQLPEDAWDRVEMLKSSYHELFTNRVDAIMEVRKLVGGGMSSSDAVDKLLAEKGLPPQPKRSAWDSQES